MFPPMCRACTTGVSAAAFWALAVLALGCVRASPRIKPEAFDFAGGRATVRDFPGGAICEAEPRFLLDELSSVNGLLSRFLKEAAGTPWTDPAIALAEEAGTRLPPLLELHGRSIAGARRCEFAAHGAWPALLVRGLALIDQTQERLQSAPVEIRALRQAQALETWRASRLAQQESARRACPPRSPGPVIYFAWREGPVFTWLFCDGAQITRDGKQRPQLERAPEELGRQRRPAEGAYLSAMGRFPAAAVMAAPGDEVLTAW